MLKAKLQRVSSTDQGTVGIFTFGAESIHTLELPWRDNRTQVSCVPPGRYWLVWAKSPRMGMCYHFVKVPGRSHVLIHSANFAGDTTRGWTTQLHGCIAPCLRIGTLRNPSGRMQLAGLVSRPAVERFNAFGDKQPIQLEIL